MDRHQQQRGQDDHQAADDQAVFHRPTDLQGIDQVGEQLEGQRPQRAVDRIGRQAGIKEADGEQEKAGAGQDQPGLQVAHAVGQPFAGQDQGAQDDAKGDHRVEADQAAFEEIGQAHAGDHAVIVSGRDDETAQAKEDIDGQVGVFRLERRAKHLAEVIKHHPQRRHAAQAVEKDEVGFGGGVHARGSIAWGGLDLVTPASEWGLGPMAPNLWISAFATAPWGRMAKTEA